MRELPLNWTRTSLGAISSKGQYGWTTKAAGQGSVKLLRTTDITKGAIDWPSVPYCQEAPPDIDKYLVRPNDILISRAGSVGFSTLIASLPSPTVFASYLIRFVPCEHVAPKFVAYFLRSSDYWHQISDAAAGIALANVNAAKLADVEIPLAPLNEQTRITDKLDVVLARVDACRQRLARVPALLKRFRQAVLAAATSGTLTEEWRENQILEDDWQTVSVGAVASEVFDGPFGSNLKSKDYSEAGVRVIRLENIGWLNFIADKETFIPQEKYEVLRKHTLRAKDVLFSSFIAEEVRVCLLPEDLSEQAINKADCFCVRTDPSVCLPEFLALRLACYSTFLVLEQEVHGATRPRVNLRQLKEFTFELPPLFEQREIVRFVEVLFTYADCLEAHYTTARRQVESLPPALLAKAFRGELVPQDPNDEPASVLLERVRAMRASAGETAGLKRHKGSDRPKTSRKAEVLMVTRNDIQDTHLTTILKGRGPLTPEALWSASQLEIDDFYDQLKDEEARGLLRERRGDGPNAPRMLEAA